MNRFRHMSFALFWRVHQKSAANIPCKLALCLPKVTLRLITGGVHSAQIKNMNGVTDIDSLRAKVRDQVAFMSLFTFFSG